MIDIHEIKEAVKNEDIEFYVNDKGNIFCKDMETNKVVTVGYGSNLMKILSEMVEKQNDELGIK